MARGVGKTSAFPQTWHGDLVKLETHHSEAGTWRSKSVPKQVKLGKAVDGVASHGISRADPWCPSQANVDDKQRLQLGLDPSKELG